MERQECDLEANLASLNFSSLSFYSPHKVLPQAPGESKLYFIIMIYVIVTYLFLAKQHLGKS